MSSFFEKLKKGMGVEETATEKLEEEKPKRRTKKPKKIEIEEKVIKLKREENKTSGGGEEEEKVLWKSEGEENREVWEKEEKEKWFEPEGELAVDVYQTNEEIVIQSTIAGVKSADLDIAIEGDAITIKGRRDIPSETKERNYFYQECYWGPFSRQVILPEEVDPSRAEASMKEGILTIRMPKIERQKRRKVLVKD